MGGGPGESPVAWRWGLRGDHGSGGVRRVTQEQICSVWWQWRQEDGEEGAEGREPPWEPGDGVAVRMLPTMTNNPIQPLNMVLESDSTKPCWSPCPVGEGYAGPDEGEYLMNARGRLTTLEERVNN